MKMLDLNETRQFAIERHGLQLYGDCAFPVHLSSVEFQLRYFGHDSTELLQAAWLHDILEDTTTTWEDLCERFSLATCMMVLGVTDILVDKDGQKLPNRAARQTLTYSRLRRIAVEYPSVVDLKLADRLANLHASLFAGINSHHLGMYLEEHPFFCRSVGSAGGDPKMWKMLDKCVHKGYKVLYTPKCDQSL